MATDALAPMAQTAAPKMKSELLQQRIRAARWFLVPMLIALAIVAGWPLLRSIWFSFTDVTLNDLYGAEWVGFSNYLRWQVLESGTVRYRGVLADPAWWNAVWNTVRFAFWSVAWETVLGMVVALVLNAEFRGRGIVRAAILIPWAIPTIVSAKMWSWMLNDQFGIINDLGMTRRQQWRQCRGFRPALYRTRHGPWLGQPGHRQVRCVYRSGRLGRKRHGPDPSRRHCHPGQSICPGPDRGHPQALPAPRHCPIYRRRRKEPRELLLRVGMQRSIDASARTSAAPPP